MDIILQKVENGSEGYKHTKEAKKKMSKIKKGIKRPDISERLRKNNPMKNPKIRAKISEAMQRNKNSQGKKNPNCHSVSSEIKRLKTRLKKLKAG